ncbi:LysR family transcriptional regulator [Vibrio sonorensis]|uniref:LysR family transcriptional regulator n=1 Tax=Vibrio sonorensis TaxID=1004316 RepID=UPI0008DAEF89|nr:LysR family transcriptional regulator [Vibrio sonorensis]
MNPYKHLPHSHNLLKVFESVVRLSSFTRAAQELHVTQSAVSRQVKKLEEEIGINLILRKHRSIEVTQEGLALFKALQEHYSSVDSLIASWNESRKERLVIKTANSFATRVLIPNLHKLNDKYPNHEIVVIPLIEGDPELSDTDYDILIINSCNWEKYENQPGIFKLRDEYMAPVYAQRFASQDMDLASILKQPRLHPSLDHLDWKLWIKQAGVRNAPKVRNSTFMSLDLAMSACLTGQGITVTDLLLVLPELEQGFLRCATDTPIQSSAWRYYCHCPKNSQIAIEVYDWLAFHSEQQVKKLKSLADEHGWLGFSGQ